MKLFATAAAIAALVGTAALADDNDLFVTQSGNNNVIGNADQPATQIGTQHLATFVQGGNDNSIGDVGPNVNNMGQSGFRHTLEINQSGHRNNVERYTQLGEKNEMTIRQSGNDNNLGLSRQQGQNNTADVVQRGNENNGTFRQLGNGNMVDVVQRGHRNDFDILSGDFGASNSCSSCDVILTQPGNENYANVLQSGVSQLADISQSGNGNTVYTSQSAN
ncbi:MAG: hypothetical protein RIA08_17580 [Roseovarius sp.]|uniref:hypothetical protein n=1 Tax=Roseovarius sp. TaxID=1486281 RepID=UPI0032ECB43F